MSRETESSSSPLEAIRRKEAEVKRRLAAERETAEALQVEAERRARELLMAAESEGRQSGEAQRQAALAAVRRDVEEIIARARDQAENLQRAAEGQMHSAIQHAIEIVVGGPREA